MKRMILLTLILLALPWAVRAQDITPQMIQDSLNAQERIIRRHKSNLWAFLDSLYRASREVDIIPSGVWYLDTSDFAKRLYDSIAAPDTLLPQGARVYIREYIPLDSVPITKCEIQLVSIKDGWKRLFCDTTGWRVTKEKITERRIK